jgi:hypothetical protein
MSIKVTSWALNDAPVDDPVLVLVLVAMAERANDDGTATYQSVATIAHKARISVRTCQTRLRQLEEAGLIRRGDQEFTAHLKAGQRPVVYDLAVHLRRGAISAPVQNRGWRGATPGKGGVQRVADNSSSDSSIDSSTLFAQEPSVVKAKKSSTSVPDKISISAEMKEWALANAPSVVHSLARETESFMDWNRAHGRKYIDWTAAWRNWMRKAHEMNAQGARGRAVHQPTQPQENNGRRLGINYDEPDTDAVSTSTR